VPRARPSTGSGRARRELVGWRARRRACMRGGPKGPPLSLAATGLARAVLSRAGVADNDTTCHRGRRQSKSATVHGYETARRRLPPRTPRTTNVDRNRRCTPMDADTAGHCLLPGCSLRRVVRRHRRESASIGGCMALSSLAVDVIRRAAAVNGYPSSLSSSASSVISVASPCPLARTSSFLRHRTAAAGSAKASSG
jgi:hypothetical protein